jgi:hypothetical protein
MADMDVFAAMGISGFGKAAPSKQLDAARFDKMKREPEKVILVYISLISPTHFFPACAIGAGRQLV